MILRYFNNSLFKYWESRFVKRFTVISKIVLANELALGTIKRVMVAVGLLFKRTLLSQAAGYAAVFSRITTNVTRGNRERLIKSKYNRSPGYQKTTLFRHFNYQRVVHC